MKHLIVQDWINTSGNHAGMVHMCKLLCEKYPNDYRMYIQPCPINEREGSFIHWLYRRCHTHILNRLLPYLLEHDTSKTKRKIINDLFKELNDGDDVFLLEYMLKHSDQIYFARYIKEHFRNVRIHALSHLTVQDYKEFSKDWLDVKEWASYTDTILTLGSSLSTFFKDSDIAEDKISTGFHYVDCDYYHKQLPLKQLDKSESPNAIVMGAMKRDYVLLVDVVKRCPNVHWTICRGRKKVDYLFEGLKNVSLKGFLSEDELRHQMDMADISVNIMNDTIGSNVITTSMAMGLAMIVSDVGSIRDYCDESNAVFCQNTVESFASAVNSLDKDRIRLYNLRVAATERSKDFMISNVDKWFNSLSK